LQWREMLSINFKKGGKITKGKKLPDVSASTSICPLGGKLSARWKGGPFHSGKEDR